MKYLIDTHIFLWMLFDETKLTEQAKKILSNINNEIYISLVSYWEISLKFSIGKIELEGIKPDELPDKAKDLGIQLLKITEYEVSTFYKLPRFEHKDPFDRLIIWQAINNNLILISKDKNFEDYLKFGLRLL
ncbi:DNA-binding protein [Candidatus Magnetomorum sp. HK-1]|nr:DNA-binding protein [Candidatus Magnetomorum sp. HK-1]